MPKTALPRAFRYLYNRHSSRHCLWIGKLRGVLPVYRRLVRLLMLPAVLGNGLVLVEAHGYAMYVNPYELSDAYYLGGGEPVTTASFRTLIRPGNVVVDVGAHWGYFTLLAASLCGDSGKAFAFEPHPHNYAMLAENVSTHRLGNVVVIQKALSNCSSKATLLVRMDSGGRSLALPTGENADKDSPTRVSVDTVTLDEFFAQSSSTPDFVETNIEGAGPRALAGKQFVIEDSQNLRLMLKYNPFCRTQDGAEVLTTLATQGFHIAIIDDARVQPESGSHESILRRLLFRDYTTNLLGKGNHAEFSRPLSHDGPLLEFGGARRVDRL